MINAKMIRFTLTLVIITMMLFAGCDIHISIPAHQGFYGTIKVLHGTMTKVSDDYYTFKQSSPATIPTYRINFDFVLRMGDYHKKASSNELGNFLVTCNPPMYNDDNKAKFYIVSATSGTRRNSQHETKLNINDQITYVAFIKDPNNGNKYHSMSAIPDKGIIPGSWPAVEKGVIHPTKNQYYVIDLTDVVTQ